VPSLTLLTGRPDRATAVIAGVGAAGAALVAWTSYAVGTGPGHHLDPARASGPERWPYEVGVALLVLAWLALGRLVLDPTVGAMTRRVCWAGAAMAVPLLASAPLTSQDAWAYLAQANVAVHGLDPYSVGPAAVPGPFTDAVAREWLQTGSPYGPLWIGICRGVVTVVGPHPWAGVFALRALAGAGMVVIAFALVRLCRATGARPEFALWLAVVGPFPFLMLLGGMHNDAVMLGLLLCGVAAAATAPALWRAVLLGALLVGCAGAIKANAMVVAPILPLVWHRYAAPAGEPDRDPIPIRLWVRAGAAATLTGIVVVFLLGLVQGFGVGWVAHLDEARIGVQWLSLPQQVGNLAHVLAPGHVAELRRDRWNLVHPVGLVFTACALGIVTLTARRRPPLRTLAWLMLVLAVGTPAPRPWYLLWPLVFLAADRVPMRLLVPAVAGLAALSLWYPPSVRPPVPAWVLLVLFVPLLAVVAAVVRRVPAGAPVPERTG
jgi:alpha-1,6-mannosyltransferase